MEPSIYNFNIIQGSLFTRTITWTDETPTPINLTGYSARLQARNSSDSTVKLIDLDSDDITLGGAAGTIIISISATTTATYNFETALYNLELIPPSGEGQALCLLRGTITLIKEHTK